MLGRLLDVFCLKSHRLYACDSDATREHVTQAQSNHSTACETTKGKSFLSSRKSVAQIDHRNSLIRNLATFLPQHLRHKQAAELLRTERQSNHQQKSPLYTTNTTMMRRAVFTIARQTPCRAPLAARSFSVSAARRCMCTFSYHSEGEDSCKLSSS
jgi:hypothetical protein